MNIKKLYLDIEKCMNKMKDLTGEKLRIGDKQKFQPFAAVSSTPPHVYYHILHSLANTKLFFTIFFLCDDLIFVQNGLK